MLRHSKLLKKLQITSLLQLSFSPPPADISECASNPCQNGGSCVEGVNQYKCTCPQNWSGSHCQHQTQTGEHHHIHVSELILHMLPPPLWRWRRCPCSPTMQRHLSGVLWMIQHSAGDLAVPRWTKPNTAAVMQAFTWVAPLTTVSVRVSGNDLLLYWSLRGKSNKDAPLNISAVNVTGALLLKRSWNAWIFCFFSD